ncbi:MAG: glycoside hydrolase family 78 protein [Armatimonadota bacterium]
MTASTRVRLGSYFLFALLLLTVPAALLVTHLDSVRHAKQWVPTKAGVKLANANYRPQAVEWAKKTHGLSTAGAEKYVRDHEKRTNTSLDLTDTLPFGAQVDYFSVDATKAVQTAKLDGSSTLLPAANPVAQAYVREAKNLPALKKSPDFLDTLASTLKKGYVMVPTAFTQALGGASKKGISTKAVTQNIRVAVICTALPGFRDISPRSDGDTEANDTGSASVAYGTRAPSATPAELVYRQVPDDAVNAGKVYNFASQTDTPAGRDGDYGTAFGSIFDTPGGVFSTGATWGVPTGVPAQWDYTQDAMAPATSLASNLALQNFMYDLFFHPVFSRTSVNNFFYQQSHGQIKIDGTANDVVGWLTSAHQTNRYPYQIGGGNAEFVFPGTPVIRSGEGSTPKPDPNANPSANQILRATLSERGLTILFSRPVAFNISQLRLTAASNSLVTVSPVPAPGTNYTTVTGGNVSINFSTSVSTYAVRMDPYDDRRWTITNTGGTGFKYQYYTGAVATPTTTTGTWTPTTGGAWNLSYNGFTDTAGTVLTAANVPLQGGATSYQSQTLVHGGQRQGCPDLQNTLIDDDDMVLSKFDHSLLNDPAERYNAASTNTAVRFGDRPFARLKSLWYYTHSYSGATTRQIAHLSNEWGYPDDISGTAVRSGDDGYNPRVYPFDTGPSDTWNGGYWGTGATVREASASDYSTDVGKVMADNGIILTGYDRKIYVAADGFGNRAGGFQPSSSLDNINESGLGVVYHELAHTFGAGDLYDNDLYANNAVPRPNPLYHECAAMGPYSLMDAGGRLDAYSLINMGLAVPQVVDRDTLGMQIPEIEGQLRDPVILKLPANPYYLKKNIPHTDWREYFLVENRNVNSSDGNGGYGMDSSPKGLYIYHIDVRGAARNNLNQGGFQREDDLLSVIIEQADGLFQLEFNNKGNAGTTATDPFGANTASRVSRFWQFPMFNGDLNDSGTPVVVASTAGSPTSYSHGMTSTERGGVGTDIVEPPDETSQPTVTGGSGVIEPGTETDSFSRLINISGIGNTMTADVYVEPAELRVTGVSLINPGDTVRQGDLDVAVMKLNMENREDTTAGKTDMSKMSTKDVYVDTLRILESGTSTDGNNLSKVKLYADSNNNDTFDKPGTADPDTLLATTVVITTPGRWRDHAIFQNLGYRVPKGATSKLFVAYDIAPEAQTNPMITIGAEFTDPTKILPRAPGTVEVRLRKDNNPTTESAAVGTPPKYPGLYGTDPYNFGQYMFPIYSHTAVIHNWDDRLVASQPLQPDTTTVIPGQSAVPLLRMHLETNVAGTTRTEGFVRISELAVDAESESVTPIADFVGTSDLLNAELWLDKNKNGVIDFTGVPATDDTKLGQSSFTETPAGDIQARFINLNLSILAGAANAQDLLVGVNVAPGAGVGKKFKLSVKFPNPGPWATPSTNTQEGCYIQVMNSTGELAENRDWVAWAKETTDPAALTIAWPMESKVVTVDNPNNPPNEPKGTGFAATGTAILADNPTLTWPAATDPDPLDTPDTLSYRVDLATDGTFGTIIRSINTTSANVTSWQIPLPLLTAGNYFWRVYTRDSHGAYSLKPSETQQFTALINQAPVLPLTPITEWSPVERVPVMSSSSPVIVLTPEIRWPVAIDDGPANEITYQLMIDDNADYSSPVALPAAAATLSTNSYVLPSGLLNWGMTYYWRVQAKDATGNISYWSDDTANNGVVRFFRVVNDRPPKTPIALQVDGRPSTSGLESLTGNPVLSWSMPVPPDDDPADTLATLHYEVQVKFGDGDFATGTVYTRTTPDGPTLLRWAVGLASEQSVPAAPALVADNEHVYWRVRSVDGSPVPSVWTAVQDFYVNTVNNAPDTPTGLEPNGGVAGPGALVTTRTPTLTWDNSGDPDLDPYDGAFTNGLTVGISWIIELSSSAAFPDASKYVYNRPALTAAGNPTFAVPVQLTDATTWYWRVLAVDNDGKQSGWSSTATLYVDTAQNLPTPPVAPFVPSNGSSISDDTPRFSWGAGSDQEDPTSALRYEVEISDAANFATTGYYFAGSTAANDQTWLDITSALADNVPYYWHVRTVDTSAGRSAWTATMAFTKVGNSIPNGITSGFAPTGGAQIADQTPTLQWNAATPPDPDADDTAATMHYEVQVDDDGVNFASPEFGLTIPARTPVAGVTEITVTTTLSVGVTYYWRVRAVDDGGAVGDWQTARLSFHVVANQAPSVPVAPFTLIPVNATPAAPNVRETSSATPRISWGAASDPNDDGYYDTPAGLRYQFQLSEVEGVGSGPYTFSTTTPAGQTLVDVTATLADNTQYYYRVRTLDEAGLQSPWSAAQTFWVNTANNPPAAPGLDFLPPSGNITTLARPTLSWDNSSDCDADPYDANVGNGAVIGVHFVVELSTEANCSLATYTYNTAVGVANVTPTVDLTEGIPWYWRVKAVDDDGAASQWSPIQNFTVNTSQHLPLAPTGLQPAGPTAVAGSLTPRLSWGAASDQDDPPQSPDTLRYEVQVSADPNMAVAPEYYWTNAGALPTAGQTYIEIPQAQPLVLGQRYYWRVRTVDPTNLVSAWTPIQQFMVGTNRPPTVPVAPFVPTGNLGVSDPTPLLSWGAGGDADANDTPDVLRYQVQVDDNTDFSSMLFNRTTTLSGVTEIECLPTTPLREGAVYYWRVRTIDVAGEFSGWTASCSFHLIQNRAPFAPVSPFRVEGLPAGREINTATPTVTWGMPVTPDPDPNDTLDVLRYQVQVSDKADMAIGPYVFTVTTTVTDPNLMQAIVTERLLDNTHYWWRVRAMDVGGLVSDWSPTQDFWVNLVNQAPRAPDSGFDPANGRQIVDDTPAISWTAAIDDDPFDGPTLHYIVELSKLEDFSRIDYQYTTADGVTTTTATVALTDRTTWYWRVRAVDDDGAQSPWSVVQNFVLDMNNQPPVLSNPVVNPMYGPRGITYTLEVTYTDAEGDAPGKVYCGFDDGRPDLEMTAISGTARTGILYRVGVTGAYLGLGAHSHAFSCDAGARLPLTGYDLGPVVGVSSTIALTDASGVTKTTFEEGQPIYVTVQDDDENNDPAAQDTLPVQITEAGGDNEIVTLTETGADSGIFRGSVPTRGKVGLPLDGVLNAIGGTNGNLITASYMDPDDTNNPTPDVCSTTAMLFDTVAPARVGGRLSVTSGIDGRTADLTWDSYDEAAQVDLAGYHIYRSTTDFTDTSAMTPIDTVAAGTRSYQASGLVPNTTYYFAVGTFDEVPLERRDVTASRLVAVDSNPPAISGLMPADDATEVARDTTISFDLDDPGVGIDVSTLQVVVTQNGQAISCLAPVVTGDAAHSHVVVTPRAPLLWNGIVQVAVTVSDLGGYQLVFSDWTFSVVTDNDSPTIEAQTPAPDATSVPVSTTIGWHLRDAKSGINTSTIKMKLNGVDVSGDLSTSGQPSDIAVLYDPPTDLSYNLTHTVEVNAEDVAGNALPTATWSFQTVRDATGIVIDQYNPARDAVDVPVETNISLRLTDPQAGINLSTFRFSVQGVDVTNSVTLTQTPDPSDHPTTLLVSYDPPQNLPYATDIYVNVQVQDVVDNTTDLTYKFTTVEAPTYNVSGMITDTEGAALPGVRVTAGALETLSDGTGAYRIVGLLEGTYTVSVSRAEYVFDVAQQEVTLAGDDAANVDFVGRLLTYSLRGTVKEAGAGLAGVSVAAGGKTAITADDGTYSIDNLPNGQYTVTPTLTNYHFQPQTRSAEVASADVSGVDFAAIADTFTVQGTVKDSLGNELQGVQVICGTAVAVTNAAGEYTVTGLRAGTYTLSASKAGYTINPGTVEVTVPPSRTGVNFTALISMSNTFPSGWSLVGVPGTPADQNANTAFGTAACYRWDPESTPATYRAPFNDPLLEVVRVRPGRGYFVNYDRQTTVQIAGEPTDPTRTVSIGLSEGWNMIANTQSMPTKWSRFVPSQADGIRPFAFVYDGVTGSYKLISSLPSVGAARDSLLGWEGAWVRAVSGGVSLLVTAGSGTAEAIVKPQQADLNGGWVIPVVAKAGDRADLTSVAGLVPGSNGQHVIENPPTAPKTVDVYFTNAAGQRLAHDVRSQAGAQTYSFVVACAVPDTNVTVRLPDLSQVPAAMQIMLVDKATGKSLYARTLQSYKYHSAGESSEREFELIIAPRTAGVLAVTATNASSSADGMMMTYSVTKACSVNVRVLNLAGRSVKVLAANKLVGAGVQTQLWNLTSDSGTKVPSGTYLLQIDAVAENGQSVRGLTQVRVGR